MFMKNIRDDRWTDWLIDEEHRWENIDRVKPARWILGILFLLLVYLIIGLIFAGLSMLVLHVFDLEKIGSNTILPFSFLNSDYKYLFACIALVLSLATVIYKYRKDNTGERVLFFLYFYACLFFSYTINGSCDYSCNLLCESKFWCKRGSGKGCCYKRISWDINAKGNEIVLSYKDTWNK